MSEEIRPDEPAAAGAGPRYDARPRWVTALLVAAGVVVVVVLVLLVSGGDHGPGRHMGLRADRSAGWGAAGSSGTPGGDRWY